MRALFYIYFTVFFFSMLMFVLYFCFSDYDECTEDTHNCSKEGGLCNNTKGSFNCTCKAGFTGDGHNCTGTLSFVNTKQDKMQLFSE